MSARLPLTAAQPGIWMAEQLSTLPNAWSVAHYTELKGDIDAPLLAKAILGQSGLQQSWPKYEQPLYYCPKICKPGFTISGCSQCPIKGNRQLLY